MLIEERPRQISAQEPVRLPIDIKHRDFRLILDIASIDIGLMRWH